MMTAVLFSSPVQRFVVDVQDKSSIDVEPDADNDGIRRDSAWWVSSPWKRSVADLDTHKSLAVLGEPGVGKSTTIAGLVGDGPSVNYVHLDEAADVRLLRELLEPTVSATAAEGRPTLVLDGVDECPLPPKALVRHVVRAVSQRPGVRVVVGCRTGDWSTTLSDGLRDGLGSLDVVELLPLSLEDIIARVSRRAHTAIEIARSSDAQEVVPDIEALVVCADLNSYLRSSAAHGLADLASDRAVAALPGVLDEVMEHPDHDPEDELRGIALEACWPKALAVPDLLLALTAPKNPNYFGSYLVLAKPRRGRGSAFVRTWTSVGR